MIARSQFTPIEQIAADTCIVTPVRDARYVTPVRDARYVHQFDLDYR